jgi:urea transporter
MRGRGQGENMKDYNFEVLKDGAVVVSSHSIPLPDLAAAWSKIAHLAGTVEGPGYKIRVKDEIGGIVILVGVATARRYADAFAA